MAVLLVLLLLRRLVVLVLLRWRLVWPTEQWATTVLWLHVWLPQ